MVDTRDRASLEWARKVIMMRRVALMTALLAGAAAIQVGTANFWDPCATEKIIDGLQRWCVEHRVKRVTDLIGALEV